MTSVEGNAPEHHTSERAGDQRETRAVRGRLRRALSRITAGSAELEAQELQAAALSPGCARVCDTGERKVATVRGVVRTVTLAPRAGLPALEAELYDGSGAMTLIWLGRRRVSGVDCGRPLQASGRVAVLEGRRVIFNPRYELLPIGSM